MTTYSPKILVTGGNGQIAKAIKAHSLTTQFQLIFKSRDTLDITSNDAIKRILDDVEPDFIINTAAYTAVDKAESERDTAFFTNAEGAKQLAIAANDNRIPLLHLSTDYVFSGKQNTAYKETDKPEPINAYGESKLRGEEAIRNYCAQYLILRVSGVFSEFGHNFLKTILRLANEREILRIVSDQITSPTYAGDIAGALLMILQQNKFTPGTFHYCSQEQLSWCDFARLIVDKARANMPIKTTSVEAITTNEYPTAAKRPLFSVLNCSKIESTYKIMQPTVSVGIEASLRNR